MPLRKHLPVIVAALAAMALGLSGAAETVWTGFFDHCYHAAPNCALANGALAPIDRDEAVEKKALAPCHACVVDSAAYDGVEAVMRAGTVVVRVPDDWAAQAGASRDLSSASSFTPLWSADADGAEANRLLARLLHGEAYVDALAQIADGRPCRADLALPEVNIPDVECQLLNARHIGGAWLFTLRPGEAVREAMAEDDRLDVELRIFLGTVSVEGGRLTAACNRAVADDRPLSLNRTRNSVTFGAEYDGFDLTAYGERDAYICVIHEHEPDPDRLEGVRLLLDGVDCDIEMNGYLGGEGATYCCTLAEGELEALLLNAQPSLFRDSADVGSNGT